jgi:fucose permease
MNFLQIDWIFGLLACGMGVALLGSVKVALARRLAMDEVKVGGLVSMFGFVMIPVMLVMGFLTDLLDKQVVVVAGSVLIAASLVTLACARRYWAALLAVLLLSAGWSGLVNVLNVLMEAAFGRGPTFAMNFGNFFFGLGAFLTPLAIAFLLRRAGFVPAVLLLAAAALLPGVLACTVDFAALTGAPGKVVAGPSIEVLLGDPIMWLTGPSIEVLLGDPIMWLTAVALLFYAPMEATMAAWTTTYLGEKKVSETVAATVLSGFWLAFMVSRLVTALIVAQYPLTASGTNWLIVGLSLCCVVVWAGTVVARTQRLACLMPILAGLAFGPTFPTIIGVLTGHVDQAVAGRAVGLFFMVGGIGWSVIPILIGAYARRTSLSKAFLIAVASAIGLTLTALALRPYMV